jgi:thioredoxin reductase (NADPH)
MTMPRPDNEHSRNFERYDVAIIGAGPIGLETAIRLKDEGVDFVHIEAGQIGKVIADFPPRTQFFSSNERIAIAGIPIPSPDQTKSRREEYLAYLRSVATHFELDVRTYQRVIGIARGEGWFDVQTHTPLGHAYRYRVNRIVLATGGTARRRTLDIPGEDLPHVTHDLGEVHRFYKRRVVIVGGKNSAVESALRCWHVGAEVTISYRKAAFPERVKYWLLPEMEMLIRTGRVAAHFETVPVEITRDVVRLKRVGNGETIDVPADHVLLMIGYEADMSLFRMVGVTLEGPNETPVFNEATMETDLPGVYVAGTASAGTQSGFKVFIENSHIHAERIAAALVGKPPPAPPKPVVLPES